MITYDYPVNLNNSQKKLRGSNETDIDLNELSIPCMMEEKFTLGDTLEGNDPKAL